MLIYVYFSEVVIFFLSSGTPEFLKIYYVIIREPFKLLFTTQRALIKQNVHINVFYWFTVASEYKCIKWINRFDYVDLKCERLCDIWYYYCGSNDSGFCPGHRLPGLITLLSLAKQIWLNFNPCNIKFLFFCVEWQYLLK